MHRALIALALLAAGVLPANALPAGSESGKLEASLSGKAAVPKGAPNGSGEVAVTIAGAKVCWRFKDVRGIGTALAAHIHRGAAGRAGPVVVSLGKSYRPSGCVRVPAGVANAILARPSGYYVNVHTAKYAAGAIRGQLKADDSAKGG